MTWWNWHTCEEIRETEFLTLWLWGFYLGGLVLLSPPLLLVLPDGLQAWVSANLIWTSMRRVIKQCQRPVPSHLITVSLWHCLSPRPNFSGICVWAPLTNIHEFKPWNSSHTFCDCWFHQCGFNVLLAKQTEKYESRHIHWPGLASLSLSSLSDRCLVWFTTLCPAWSKSCVYQPIA